MPKSLFRASSANAVQSDFSVSQNQFFTKVDKVIEEKEPQTKVNLANKAPNGKPLDQDEQKPKDFTKIGDQLKLLKNKTKGLLQSEDMDKVEKIFNSKKKQRKEAAYRGLSHSVNRNNPSNTADGTRIYENDR